MNEADAIGVAGPGQEAGDAGEGISPVTRVYRASTNTKAFLTIGVSVVLLAAVGALVMSRSSARRAQDASQRRVDAQVTALCPRGRD